MEYKRPLVYRDRREVHVQTWVTRIGNSSFDVAHRIVDPGDLGPDAKPYAACFSTMVATNKEAQRSRKLRASEIAMLEGYMQPDLPVPNPAGRRGPQ
jgi:acyl-CoA thioesterase FadM